MMFLCNIHSINSYFLAANVINAFTFRELKMYKQNPAETGDLAFNTESGDRLNSEYHILNMRESQPHLIPVATWTAEQVRRKRISFSSEVC